MILNFFFEKVFAPTTSPHPITPLYIGMSSSLSVCLSWWCAAFYCMFRYGPMYAEKKNKKMMEV